MIDKVFIKWWFWAIFPIVAAFTINFIFMYDTLLFHLWIKLSLAEQLFMVPWSLAMWWGIMRPNINSKKSNP